MLSATRRLLLRTRHARRSPSLSLSSSSLSLSLSPRLSPSFSPRLSSSLSSSSASSASASSAKSAAVTSLAAQDRFVARHVGPRDEDIAHMLDKVGLSSLQELVDRTVPDSIQYAADHELGVGPSDQSESEVLARLRGMMEKNVLAQNHLGAGYYGTKTPNVILRNLLENPGWYTPYTPYSAEIAQGRLEMLINFQTMVTDLTGLPCANASLLDEATAGAEAVNLCRSSSRKKSAFVVANDVFPHTVDVVRTRARGHDTEIRAMDMSEIKAHLETHDDVCGIMLQYPNNMGLADGDYAALTETAHSHGAKVCVAADILALTVMTPPGEWGADIVFGTTQRFGVPMGYGGPHAAYFATGAHVQRKVPGRIIGVSVDRRGGLAYRMAMQTREQHIRRDKATSNICTAQALLANTSAAYAIYHGPDGLRNIAQRVKLAAHVFAEGAQRLGYKVLGADSDTEASFFDTVCLHVPGEAHHVVRTAFEHDVNLRLVDDQHVTVSFDETTTAEHIDNLFNILAESNGVDRGSFTAEELAGQTHASFPEPLRRTSDYLTHEVFNSYHSETEMMRYLFKLQRKDLGLDTSMIPLGSCTMKLNAASEMIPITWPHVNQIHPFAPPTQTVGYMEMIEQLDAALARATGFAATSFQPNSGAQGEYTGLMAIDAYHRERGDSQRRVCLIPTSAHGTNPASAVMAGMKVVPVKCDNNGNIDTTDLKAKAAKHAENLSALMITYPSTHGVFEEDVKDIIKTVHDHGGLVYMDGANLNAQLGLCSPGDMGADVCHLNLHKTFCIPHGGGGPGMGPICVNERLAPYLPTHVNNLEAGGVPGKAISAVAAAPFASASILPISWMYMHMMGDGGLKKATMTAILSANYMAKRLEDHYSILYRGRNGLVAHEFIIDMRPIKASCGITEEDVAKRLVDYNLHAPTMSWPVVGTLMIEPTESESLAEIDRFCDAMINIREEIREVETGKADKLQNVLKAAPFTAAETVSDSWPHPFSRDQAAFPLPYLRHNKFWPTVSRIDNVAGDRNLVCTCPPMDSYADDE